MTRNNADFQGYFSPEYGTHVPKLYHGTGAELSPGDVIEAKSQVSSKRMGRFGEDLDQLKEQGFALDEMEGSYAAHATDDLDYAKTYATGSGGGSKHVDSKEGSGGVYEVEPVNKDDLRHIEYQDFASPSGFRVVSKVQFK